MLICKILYIPIPLAFEGERSNDSEVNKLVLSFWYIETLSQILIKPSKEWSYYI